MACVCVPVCLVVRVHRCGHHAHPCGAKCQQPTCSQLQLQLLTSLALPMSLRYSPDVLLHALHPLLLHPRPAGLCLPRPRLTSCTVFVVFAFPAFTRQHPSPRPPLCILPAPALARRHTLPVPLCLIPIIRTHAAVRCHWPCDHEAIDQDNQLTPPVPLSPAPHPQPPCCLALLPPCLTWAQCSTS